MNIFIWIYLGAGAVSLYLSAITLLAAFYVVPKLILSHAPRAERMAGWLLLLAYTLFLADAFLCMSAFGGTLGDGATSTHRYVNPDYLLPVGILQVACFVRWRRTRARADRQTAVCTLRHRLATNLLLAPGVVPIVLILKVATTTYLRFKGTN